MMMTSFKISDQVLIAQDGDGDSGHETGYKMDDVDDDVDHDDDTQEPYIETQTFVPAATRTPK